MAADGSIDTDDLQLYKKREQIQPKLVRGKYRQLKWIVLAITLGIYYLLPWARWPRGEDQPSQAVLVDFEGQRFYFFSIEIWPDELYFVTGLLVLSALALFLITALFGRLWCGYACPQTVWTDLFIAVERWIEGDRNKRLQLDKQAWSFSKITKKVSKHSIWLLIAAATGGAWVLYFHDAPTVVGHLLTGEAPGSAYLFFGILTFTTYSLAGLMREQVCTYMCPWPRIQAAMTDNDTLNVGYYAARGEPRGKHKKGAEATGQGDCIDCKACVVVCPMGIDIREGDQLECINCGLCADACDDIMKKIGKPIGLVAYGADYRTAARGDARVRFPVWLRARTIFYAGMFSLVSVVMIFGLMTKGGLEFDIERNRAPAYTTLSDGSVRNALLVRILNKNSLAQPYELSFEGAPGLTISKVGDEVTGNVVDFTIDANHLSKSRVFLTYPPAALRSDADLDITVRVRNKETGETRKRVLPFVQEDM